MLLLVSLVPTLCAGCATNPLPEDLVRTLPATCQKLLKQTPLPPVTATTDAREAWARDDAALQASNARTAAAQKCESDMAKAYAAPAKKGK